MYCTYEYTYYVRSYVRMYVSTICTYVKRERARERKCTRATLQPAFGLPVHVCVSVLCLYVCVCALCVFVCTSNFCFGKNSCVSSHSRSFSLASLFKFLTRLLSFSCRSLSRTLRLSLFLFPTHTHTYCHPLSLTVSLLLSGRIFCANAIHVQGQYQNALV